jgi:L-alanine-DL-glutamate epimerase-like enolase superfamily enzyme
MGVVDEAEKAEAMGDGDGVRVVIRALHPRNVFRISRSARGEVENVFVRWRHEGVDGFGEASPNPFYDESAGDVRERVLGCAEWLAGLKVDSVEAIAAVWEAVWERVAPSRAAQCAIDLALWDGVAKRRGVSVTRLALGREARPVLTFGTIGLERAEALAERLEALRGWPRIKLKSDAQADLDALEMLRGTPGTMEATVAVDANGSWGAVDVSQVARALARLGVAFLEQPLHPGEDDRMEGLLRAVPLPVMADESCVTAEDVGRMPGRFAGFNIKLVKCGGLTPALAMAREGRARGLRTMVGCMLESSLLIAAGVVVAQLTDDADLDGAWLLRDDPFTGLPVRDGVLRPQERPGFGVEPVGSLAATF